MERHRKIGEIVYLILKNFLQASSSVGSAARDPGRVSAPRRLPGGRQRMHRGCSCHTRQVNNFMIKRKSETSTEHSAIEPWYQ